MGSGFGKLLAQCCFRAIDRGSCLQSEVGSAQGNFNQGAVAIVAGQPAPQERMTAGDDFAELLQCGNAVIHQKKVLSIENTIRAFEGKNEPARKHIVGKGLTQKLITPDAGTALGEKSQIVIQCLAIPGRRDPGQAKAADEPGCADDPGVSRRKTTQDTKHAQGLPVAERSGAKDSLIIGEQEEPAGEKARAILGGVGSGWKQGGNEEGVQHA